MAASTFILPRIIMLVASRNASTLDEFHHETMQELREILQTVRNGILELTPETSLTMNAH
jgi:hypothetical protein